MTKDEIKKADEQTLQARWIELMKTSDAYVPGKNKINREYLMIGVRLNLMRGQTDEAIIYSEELQRRYSDSIK